MSLFHAGNVGAGTGSVVGVGATVRAVGSTGPAATGCVEIGFNTSGGSGTGAVDVAAAGITGCGIVGLATGRGSTFAMALTFSFGAEKSLRSISRSAELPAKSAVRTRTRPDKTDGFGTWNTPGVSATGSSEIQPRPALRLPSNSILIER